MFKTITENVRKELIRISTDSYCNIICRRGSRFTYADEANKIYKSINDLNSMDPVFVERDKDGYIVDVISAE